MSKPLATNVSVELRVDLVQEALIALRDRAFTLRQETRRSSGIVQDIVWRQLGRTEEVGRALAQSVGEVF